MALPQLNATPKYELTMPSTGKTHKFRPFLVKEEKVLMIAAESQQLRQVVHAMGDIVETCVEGVKKEDLSSIDVEYAFLQLRSKSVGEKTKLNMTCAECKTESEVEVDLASIPAPEAKAKKAKIDLGNNIYLNLATPRYTQMADLNIEEGKETESLFFLITSCIESIQTENDHFAAKDASTEELVEFVESMTTNQFAKVQEFINDLPRLNHEIKWTGPCGHKNTHKLEGVQSFF